MRQLAALPIALLTVVACAGHQNGEMDRRKSIWRDCVIKSFATQRHVIPDKNLAAEQAFIACQTEETAILNLVSPRIRYEASTIMSEHRATLKREMLAVSP